MGAPSSPDNRSTKNTTSASAAACAGSKLTPANSTGANVSRTPSPPTEGMRREMERMGMTSSR